MCRVRTKTTRPSPAAPVKTFLFALMSGRTKRSASSDSQILQNQRSSQNLLIYCSFITTRSRCRSFGRLCISFGVSSALGARCSAMTRHSTRRLTLAHRSASIIILTQCVLSFRLLFVLALGRLDVDYVALDDNLAFLSTVCYLPMLVGFDGHKSYLALASALEFASEIRCLPRFRRSLDIICGASVAPRCLR
jgi:hypothetical protein